MTDEPRFPPSSPSCWRRLGLSVAPLILASLALPGMAQDEDDEVTYTAIRGADTDTMMVSASGRATLNLSRAPVASTGAKIHVVNSAYYSLWAGDLRKQGANWVAQLDRAAVEALLKAHAVHAEFPQAAAGGKDLRIGLLRENLDGLLDSASTLIGREPLFYDAPEAPAPLEAIDPEADGIRIASYAMAAKRYEQELSAYEHLIRAAKSNAMALWIDLETAGRLPAWPPSVINAQKRAYRAIDAKADAVTQQRREIRAAAKAAVDRWNAAHGDDEPIDITFREMS